MRLRPFSTALTLALTIAVSSSRGSEAPSTSTDMQLWYNNPATDWHQALPVGNGSIGAMVFGGTARETIQLNHDSIWSAGPEPANRVGAYRHLPEIRRLLWDHEFARAEALVSAELLDNYGGGRSHQTLGDLVLEMPASAAPATGFRRSLDLVQGVARTTFSRDGVTYQRDVLASHPDQVLIVRISADRPGAVSLTATLARPDASVSVAGPDSLLMTGAARLDDGPPGVKFEVVLAGAVQGGEPVLQGLRPECA